MQLKPLTPEISLSFVQSAALVLIRQANRVSASVGNGIEGQSVRVFMTKGVFPIFAMTEIDGPIRTSE
jgi:hypothetical protein